MDNEDLLSGNVIRFAQFFLNREDARALSFAKEIGENADDAVG